MMTQKSGGLRGISPLWGGFKSLPAHFGKPSDLDARVGVVNLYSGFITLFWISV